MAEAAERSDPPLIRMGRRRESRWMPAYNDLIGIDEPHTIGFAGAGYGTYRRGL